MKQVLDTFRPRDKTVRAFVCVVVLAILARLFRLGYQSLWYDECWSLRRWQEFLGVPAAEKLSWALEGWPPYDVGMSFWIAAGTDEFLMRLPSAVFGTLTIVVIFALGSRLLDPRCGLIASLLLALSPFHVWYSQEARLYALLVLLASLSTLGFVRWLQDRSSASWWFWTLSTATAVVTFRPAVYLWLIQALFLLIHRRSYGRALAETLKRRGVWLPALLLLLAASPWIANTVAFGYNAWREPGSVLSNMQPAGLMVLPYTFFALAAGFSVGPSVVELQLPQPWEQVAHHWLELSFFVSVFSVAFVMGCRQLLRQRETMILFALHLVVPVLQIFGLARLTGHAYHVRYTAPALIPLLLIVAAGLGSNRAPGGKERMMWNRGAGLVLCLGVFLVALSGHYFNPRYMKIDRRNLARTIMDGEQTGDVIVISAYRNYDGSTCYYEGSLPITPIERTWSERSIAERLAETGPAPRVWLASIRPWRNGYEGVWPRTLLEEYRIEESWEMVGSHLFLLVRRG